MGVLLDLLYLLGAIVAVPVWIVRARTGKLRTDWPGRFGRGPDLPAPKGPRLLVYAVSVGEINAARLLVEKLEARPDGPEVVVATMTDTGFARASEVLGGRCTVLRYPIDVTFAVRRFLDRVRPDAVALIELEVWPNFTAACARRGIPVCVLNGRLSERSYRRYRLIAPFVRRMFRRLAFVAAQTGPYAERFRALGAADVRVTGTMKWDTAQLDQDPAAADRLAEEMGIDRGRALVVAGSTAPSEHELLHRAVQDPAQLLCAPRRPEWFDQAARSLPGCARRSRGERGSQSGRFVLDTIGELRAAYALADVVVIGRSFGPLHGSDMMEPACLGRAIVVGPSVSDFQDTVEALLEADALVQTTSAELASVVAALLADPARRRQLGDNARAAITARQGVTDTHVEMLAELLADGAGQKIRRPGG